jgi:hypothetical protein
MVAVITEEELFWYRSVQLVQYYGVRRCICVHRSL